MKFTSQFKIDIQHFETQLFQIEVVTKYLQNQHLSLSGCRIALDDLLEKVNRKKNVASSMFYKCKLGDKYIGRSGHLVKNRDFLSGVIKIQRKQSGCMNGRNGMPVVSFSLRKLILRTQMTAILVAMNRIQK